VQFAYKANAKKQIGMVAGGTGITPMLQVLEEIVSNPNDKTEVSLLFANNTTKDILLQEQIDALARKNKNLKVTYVIDKPEAGWTGPTGYINADMLKKYLPAPSADVQVYVCGPPGFMTVTSGNKTPDYKQGELTGALKEIGFTSDNVFKV
jgi:cytochrome-b5 reductase